jgi:hypothetical protein
VAEVVFGLLQCVFWVGTQLPLLELLGDQRKAAKVRQELQEQQQQLQQALQQAMQLLLQSAEAAGARPDLVPRLFWQLLPQHNAATTTTTTTTTSSSSSSSSNDSGEIGVLSGLAVPANPAAWNLRRAHEVLLASEALAGLYPAVLGEWQVTQAAAAGMVGCGLLQQLQDFGGALCSQLPQAYCCSNGGCSNVAGVSESKLCGKSSRCSKCKVAR